MAAESAQLDCRLTSELEYARKLYGETGNPLYVIWAIHLVTDPRLKTEEGVGPAPAIPDWCLAWLHPAFGKMMKIAHGVQRRGEPVAGEKKEKRMLTPRAATQQVSQALGLTRRGKNSFRDFGADQGDIDLAGWLEFLRDADYRPDGRPETLHELKRWLGSLRRDDSVIRKRVKRGKRLKRD